MTNYVLGISLIQDGNKAIAADVNGRLSILDQETLEIKEIAQTIKGLCQIIVI